MAFMKKSGCNSANEGYGMRLVRSTSFGRKRVALSNVRMAFGGDDDCARTVSFKRRCVRDDDGEEGYLLEDMPQEILIRILCGVEHDDLKRLFFVSRAIREATLIAKQTHFAYSTPRKTLMFRNACDFGDSTEIEAPNAPKQSRIRRSRLSAKKMADISISLFASDDLFSELES